MNIVRPKKQQPKRHLGRFLVKAVIVGVLAGSAGALGYDAYSGALDIFPQHFESETTAAGRIIKVPPGGNIRAALLQAAAGDTIELTAGALYSGQLDLPAKPLAGYITIRSSRAAELPEGVRVSPDQKPLMATITSGMFGRAAVSAGSGANHYRFVGIEFMPSGSVYNYGLVKLGGDETDPSQVPSDIEIDRCYIHAGQKGVTRRGIALNSARTTISNSYIEGFAGQNEEAQGICGWSGTRDVKIINNYIEGGAENIMFGGSDPANASLIPSGIEITGNLLTKPIAWRKKFTTKTLFELKNAKNVRFTHNYLENNWEGSAFRITVRDQDGGAEFSTIEDVEISGNIIKGSGEGINILGRDDTYPSQTLKRLSITNNVFLDLGAPGFDGSGYFIQIADGDGITIANNTVLNAGNIITFYGSLPRAFSFRDNITGHGEYGVHGLADIRSDEARSMLNGNVFINNRGVGRSDLSIPPGNDLADSIAAVGFSDLASGDLRLRPDSKYKSKGASVVPFTNR